MNGTIRNLLTQCLISEDYLKSMDSEELDEVFQKGTAMMSDEMEVDDPSSAGLNMEEKTVLLQNLKLIREERQNRMPYYSVFSNNIKDYIIVFQN